MDQTQALARAEKLTALLHEMHRRVYLGKYEHERFALGERLAKAGADNFAALWTTARTSYAPWDRAPRTHEVCVYVPRRITASMLAPTEDGYPMPRIDPPEVLRLTLGEFGDPDPGEDADPLLRLAVAFSSGHKRDGVCDQDGRFVWWRRGTPPSIHPDVALWMEATWRDTPAEPPDLDVRMSAIEAEIRALVGPFAATPLPLSME